MGYSVYPDIWNPGRWAGYGVPAECDMPGCTNRIDRGMGYQCERHYVDDDHYEEGCYLYFCSEHCYDTETHFDIDPKPDHPEWLWWIIVAPSWKQWREENPERLEEYVKQFAESGWRPGRAQYENLAWEMEDAG